MKDSDVNSNQGNIPPSSKNIVVHGSAHGGTTIIVWLLGQLPGAFATGSLNRFPAGRKFLGGGQFEEGNICGCGVETINCPFWKGVLEKLGLGGMGSNELRNLKKIPGPDKVFSAIHGMQQKEIVIDESHYVKRLQAILESKVPFSIVHVLRDVQGVVNSRVSKKIRTKGSGSKLKRLWWIFKTVIEWRVRRDFVRKVAAKKVPVVEIEYRDFCLNTADVVERIGEALGLDYSGLVKDIKDGRPIRHPEHLVKGNSRLRQNSEVTIRFDEKWRRELSPFEQRFAVMVSSVGLIYTLFRVYDFITYPFLKE